MNFDPSKPDPSLTYLVSISGGKDSTALWLHLVRELKLPDVRAVFADTGWEHPSTYEYLTYLETEIGPLSRVVPPLDFVELAISKKRFPSAKARFCTKDLKMRPMRDWIESEAEAGRIDKASLVQCVGVRAEESPSRARMGAFVECDDYYKLPQWRPIIGWTWQEVFACHARHGVKANPLYSQGMGRVGCMPCIMASLPEIGEIARRFPDVAMKVAAAEAVVQEHIGGSATFFANDKIPERFRSISHTSKKDGVTHRLCAALDVFEYAKLETEERRFGGELPKLFEEPPNEDVGVCSSIYGLCE
jgi:3'-phosphoadenosine 5'-phosphosulfate sulfotransferase (PAPS reductase)/FAD synthetase